MDQQAYVSQDSTNICTPNAIKFGLALGAAGAIGGLILGHIVGAPLLLTAGACAMGAVAGAALNSTVHFCQEKYDLKDSTVSLIHAATFAVSATAIIVAAIVCAFFGSASVAILSGIVGGITGLVAISFLAYAMMQKHNESNDPDSQTHEITETKNYSNAETHIEESAQSKQVKQQITSDLKTWSSLVNLKNFKGENFKIFYGYEIDSKFTNAHSVKSKEEFNRLIEETFLQNLINRIPPFYNDIFEINIEILIVGELDAIGDDQFVHYQSFRQSYKGNQGNGHPGLHDMEIKDSFMTDYVTHFKLIQTPADIWNGEGLFSKYNNNNNNYRK